MTARTLGCHFFYAHIYYYQHWITHRKLIENTLHMPKNSDIYLCIIIEIYNSIILIKAGRFFI
jgi:hypothetical protein